MRDIKEIFRLRFNLKLSQRKVAKATGFGKTTVKDYEARALSAGLTSMEQIEELTPSALYTKSFRVARMVRFQQFAATQGLCFRGRA